MKAFTSAGVTLPCLWALVKAWAHSTVINIWGEELVLAADELFPDDAGFVGLILLEQPLDPDVAVEHAPHCSSPSRKALMEGTAMSSRPLRFEDRPSGGFGSLPDPPDEIGIGDLLPLRVEAIDFFQVVSLLHGRWFLGVRHSHSSKEILARVGVELTGHEALSSASPLCRFAHRAVAG